MTWSDTSKMLPIGESVPCSSCGGLAECVCAPSQGSTVYNFPSIHTNTLETGLNPSYFNTISTGSANTIWSSDPAWGSNPTITGSNTCFQHVIDEASIFMREETIHGTCKTCQTAISLPRVAGGFTFEKGGSLVGRAMTLDDDDDEAIGELLAELNLLEAQVKKECVRYKRALGLVKIARDLVAQRAISDNTLVE